MQALPDTPRRAEAKELRAMPGYYRIRIERWRIIYRLDDENGSILVIRVRQKTEPEIYEDLA
jgi:mRNA-degrading endonuclease RelE of RelBE toxin-antitoxin system